MRTMTASRPGSDRLSSSDDVMLRIEADPVLRSAVTVVGALDGVPPWDQLEASVQAAVDRIPRLRQRIQAPPPWRHGQRWVDDPSFSLRHHLRRLRVAEPGTMAEVFDLAGAEMTSPFDPVRPPWTCTVVEGLDTGGAAFVLRFHHTITDGVGGVALARDLFDRRPGAQTREPPPPVARVTPNALQRSTAAVRGLARAALAPGATAAGGFRVARSAARMLAPAGDALSPLLADRSTDRRLSVLEVPLGDLRSAAKAVGGTVNDVFLAAVGGAVHDYHRRSGSSVRSLRFTMPISVRRPGDPPGGNRFVPARFTLPVDDPDPAVRAKLAGAVSRRWRREPAVPLSSLLASGLDRLPTPVLVKVFGSLLRTNDIDAVDVPGPDETAFLGGARVDRLWGFAPPMGAALSVTLLSYAGTCCIGLASDPAAVSDPALLHGCLEHSIGEVVALAARPDRREVPA